MRVEPKGLVVMHVQGSQLPVEAARVPQAKSKAEDCSAGRCEPTLSVCCWSYNDVKYIQQCLEQILAQETTFGVEVIVHDDASTDGSQDIIRQFGDAFPGRFRNILQTENQFGSGRDIQKVLFAHARGQFVALCHADDFWTSKRKLHLQVEYMLANPECAMTFHAVSHVDAQSSELVREQSLAGGTQSVSMPRLISAGGGFVPTSSVVIKREVLDALPDWFYVSPAGDYPLVLLAREHGDVVYIDANMASYRVNNPNSAMGRKLAQSPGQLIDRAVGLAEALGNFNEYTSGRYRKECLGKGRSLVFTAFRRIRARSGLFDYTAELTRRRKYLALWQVAYSVGIALLPMLATKASFREWYRRHSRSKFAETLRHSRSAARRLTSRPVLKGKPRIRVVKCLSDGKNPTFFGYHDKSPFSADGSKILANSISSSDSSAKSECTTMKVGYFRRDGKDMVDRFISIGTTTTWCWQQGCMLQWNPTAPNSEVVFNSLVDGGYGAVIVDIDSCSVVRSYQSAIYSLSRDGALAVSLDFGRLGRLRPGYGYSLLGYDKPACPAPDNDGLFLVNLESGTKKLLVSLAELRDEVVDAWSDLENSEHYINHATFSPDGKRIVFFHVATSAGQRRRKLRVCVLDLGTERLSTIEGERTVSHYCWRDSTTFLATTLDSSGVWRYTLYDSEGKQKVDLQAQLEEDGHPMFNPADSEIVVMDTYPDHRRDQHLFTLNVRTGDVEEVATLYSPFRYRGQVRCDLHPRWDGTGKYIAADTTLNGRRQLGVLSLE